MGDLTSNVKLTIDCEYRKTMDMITAIGDLAKFLVLDLADGTAADQADLLYHDEQSVAGAGNADLDLTGVLKDCFGDNFDAAKIKFLAIYNTSTAQTLTVGAEGSNPWVGPFGAGTHTVSIKPATTSNYSWIVLVADPNGYTVTAGTADMLRISNEAGSAAIFGIIIVATSA